MAPDAHAGSDFDRADLIERKCRLAAWMRKPVQRKASRFAQGTISPMSTRWKRWTAALLLVLASVTVSASASALLCSPESGCAFLSTAGAAHETERDAGECPVESWAKVAVTPAVIARFSAPAVVLPAYVRALVPARFYRIDPEPPGQAACGVSRRHAGHEGQLTRGECLDATSAWMRMPSE